VTSPDLVLEGLHHFLELGQLVSISVIYQADLLQGAANVIAEL
jgi:hypothetical protein